MQRNKKFTVGGLLVLATGLLIFFGVKNMDSNPRLIKIAFGSPWKSIHPGLQHTLIGDLTLSNQFEALVGLNENAVYVPLAAKDWTVSPDFKKFVFKIDTSKRFSDGVAPMLSKKKIRNI